MTGSKLGSCFRKHLCLGLNQDSVFSGSETKGSEGGNLENSVDRNIKDGKKGDQSPRSAPDAPELPPPTPPRLEK